MQEEIKETCLDCSDEQSLDKQEKCDKSEDLQGDKEDEQEKRITELNDSLLRLKADFDNFRRRTQKEKEDLSNLIKINVITKLLTVVDNFERGLTAAETQDGAALKTGMEMIYKQLLGFLEEIGVEKITAVGELFDPQFHQAVMRVEDTTKEEGIIISELQKGYKIDEKLIRPSMVQVVGS